jgi:hypothetical protein
VKGNILYVAQLTGDNTRRDIINKGIFYSHCNMI